MNAYSQNRAREKYPNFFKKFWWGSSGTKLILHTDMLFFYKLIFLHLVKNVVFFFCAGWQWAKIQTQIETVINMIY